MAPSPETTPPLPVVDFFDQPLAEGDRIAFTEKDDARLYAGTVKLIGSDSGREQIVIQSGQLRILEGTFMRLSGGRPEHIRFNQVVRRPAQDGA
ncbi:hypothetical protein [Streptomyces sp. NPDC047868]|uniref:hypothetical protein n=1 Tax=Streptomyces sp. NPDC047868 TaxID=3155480 RepID=UPI003456649D